MVWLIETALQSNKKYLSVLDIRREVDICVRVLQLEINFHGLPHVYCNSIDMYAFLFWSVNYCAHYEV
jgi:hypothetical protein